MKRGFVLIGLVFLLMVVGFVSAEETQLSSSDLNVINYDASNNFVVFSARDVNAVNVPFTDKDGNVHEGNLPIPDVYVYNLNSGERIELGEGTHPIIYRDRYVLFNKDNNVVVYDYLNPAMGLWTLAKKGELSSGSCSSNSKNLFCARGGAIYSVNLTSYETIKELLTADYIKQLDASEDYIIYTQESRPASDKGEMTDIWVYNLDTSNSTKLSNYGEKSRYPVLVDGARIVFGEAERSDDYTGGIKGYKIFYSDVEDEQPQELNLKYDLGRATPQMDLEDNKLVWRDSRHFNIPILGRLLYSLFGIGDNQEIYLYDFATGEGKRITHNRRDQFAPKIVGNRVFWMDSQNGKSRTLYYKDL